MYVQYILDEQVAWQRWARPDLESNHFRSGVGVLVFESGVDSESIFF